VRSNSPEHVAETINAPLDQNIRQPTQTSSMVNAMPTVFLSYSKKDYFFAELAEIKLADGQITLWRDQGQLRAGSDWRHGIERGISESLAVVVALSANSAESPYVTFEWAYALGKGKAVVPVILTECHIHPRLETIQHLDFTVAEALPWTSLINRIREIETDAESVTAIAPGTDSSPPQLEPTAKAILAYLDQRGYQMASFERLRRRINESLSDADFNEVIQRNPTVFRHAMLAGQKPGIAKLIP